MTPIKYLLLVGTSIYTVDHAGGSRLISVSPNTIDANWLANSLANYAGVEVRTYPDDAISGTRLPVEV